MSSKNIDKWLVKGLKYFDLGEYDKARKFFDKVIKNDPTNQKAWADKGTALINLGDCKEAINCLTHLFRVAVEKFKQLYRPELKINLQVRIYLFSHSENVEKRLAE